MKPTKKHKRLAIRIKAYEDAGQVKGTRKPGSLSGRK